MRLKKLNYDKIKITIRFKTLSMRFKIMTYVIIVR